MQCYEIIAACLFHFNKHLKHLIIIFWCVLAWLPIYKLVHVFFFLYFNFLYIVQG